MKLNNLFALSAFAVAAMTLFASTAIIHAEEIGTVSTTFKMLGANNKIVVDAFDDPDVAGATCYVSRAKTGGIKGSLGVAEDTSDASISCRQTGKLSLLSLIHISEPTRRTP